MIPFPTHRNHTNRTPDEFYTPRSAWNILKPYIPKEWVLWECAVGKGHLLKYMQEDGYKTAPCSSDENFFFTTKECDCIITNPPYSTKTQFFERAYMLGKPFAFLCPITTLETRSRHALFKKYGIQMIVPDKRINFIGADGTMCGKSIWFATAWFCWKLNLPKDLLFVELGED